jgi:predicted DNA-binding protein with PD1-like motif
VKYVEGKSGRVICARLAPGEDILASIRSIADKAGVDSGVFFAIGTLSKASFYFYHPCPKSVCLDRPLEIVSCSGSIARVDGKVRVHAHIDVTDAEYRSYGGHLLEGSLIDRMGFVAIFEMIGSNIADIEK